MKMRLGADYCWAITLKDNDEPIGCIDLVGINSFGVPEIGYVLSYDYWGNGIMTEAVKAVLGELFICGFDKVGACHCVDNPASGKVMEKSGMTYVRNCMAQKKFGSDEQCEVKCYEICRV
ncbi:MAG: GNAT family N-acetyltransferase [Oscillospiraceae bacterium]|nr:GNAT family N-acetyltransferase [Oscillospiraceae bacterium]